MATSNSTIPFHKHCQQTVCSAYGYGGQGATWEKISSLNLSHLSQLDSDWIDLFTHNQNNITEDLASILTLIDNVADQVSSMGAIKGFTISFQDANGVEIANQEFSASSGNYSVKLGRQVELTINGQTFSFNTMKVDDDETLVGTLPEKKIDVKAGGYSIGSVNVVASDSKDLALTSKKVNFKPSGMTSVLGTADAIWPVDQNVEFTMSDVNLMQGSGSGKLIGTFKTIYPATQSVALAENKLNLKVGNVDLAEVPFISHEDKTLAIPTKTLTLKAGITDLGSAQIVADGDKTINLATNNLTFKMGGTNLATVAIPMASQANVNIPTKEITFKKDGTPLGSFKIAGDFYDNDSEEINFQQNYNSSPATYTTLNSEHFPSGSVYSYVFKRFHVDPGIHVYRFLSVAEGYAVVNFQLTPSQYPSESVVNFELLVSNSTKDGGAPKSSRLMIFPVYWLSVGVGMEASNWRTEFKSANRDSIDSDYVNINASTLRNHLEHLNSTMGFPLGPIGSDRKLKEQDCWYYSVSAGRVAVFSIRLDMKYKLAIIERKDDYDLS